MFPWLGEMAQCLVNCPQSNCADPLVTSLSVQKATSRKPPTDATLDGRCQFCWHLRIGLTPRPLDWADGPGVFWLFCSSHVARRYRPEWFAPALPCVDLRRDGTGPRAFGGLLFPGSRAGNPKALSAVFRSRRRRTDAGTGSDKDTNVRR
jgi:hypothetical protein